MGSKRKGLFSIVIPSLNEGKMLHMTVDSILTKTTYPNYEVIIVDDGSTDGSCDLYKKYDNRVQVVRSKGLGVACARNFGVDNSEGEYICFIDAHCSVSKNWLDGFVNTLNDQRVGVVGPTFTKLQEPEPRGCGMAWIDASLETTWYYPLDTENAYDIPLTPGGCQAFRKDVFNEIGRYEEGFTRWGFEDVEICLRLWLLGYRVMGNPTVIIAHHFREARNYDVDDCKVVFNFLRMIHMHFSPPRIRKVLKAVSNNLVLESAMTALYNSDVMILREKFHMSRVRDDDWYFDKFGPDVLQGKQLN